ncbi:MAG: hypothetical protein NUV45_01340 [Tepidanaerobacteraceae bacterium]|jgi:hypothetical protein|nr:hypothetical protein [Tepidanaerobacteraceae bacterium]
MLAVAQTALTLSAQPQGFTTTDIYLRVTCAVACHCLGCEDEARRWLLSAMRLALLVAQRVPCAKIARQHCISVGRLKNIMLEICEKLYVSCREELAGRPTLALPATLITLSFGKPHIVGVRGFLAICVGSDQSSFDSLGTSVGAYFKGCRQGLLNAIEKFINSGFEAKYLIK